jgi:hypothetical protein
MNGRLRPGTRWPSRTCLLRRHEANSTTAGFFFHAFGMANASDGALLWEQAAHDASLKPSLAFPGNEYNCWAVGHPGLVVSPRLPFLFLSWREAMHFFSACLLSPRCASLLKKAPHQLREEIIPPGPWAEGQHDTPNGSVDGPSVSGPLAVPAPQRRFPRILSKKRGSQARERKCEDGKGR